MPSVASETTVLASHQPPQNSRAARAPNPGEAGSSPFAMLLDTSELARPAPSEVTERPQPPARDKSPATAHGDGASSQRPGGAAPASEKPQPRSRTAVASGNSDTSAKDGGSEDAKAADAETDSSSATIAVKSGAELTAEIAEIVASDAGEAPAQPQPTPLAVLVPAAAGSSQAAGSPVVGAATVETEAASPVTLVAAAATAEEPARRDAAALDADAAATPDAKPDERAAPHAIAAKVEARAEAPQPASAGRTNRTTADTDEALARAKTEATEHVRAPAGKSDMPADHAVRQAAHRAATELAPETPPASDPAATARPSVDPVQTLAAATSHLQAPQAAFHAQAVAHAAPAALAHANGVPLGGIAVEIAAQARAGTNRFEIRLDPPELGRIDVRLDVDRHGQVTSRLVVERAETLDLLRREAPQLERALQDAGLKTGDNALQFSLRDQSFAGRQQTPDRHAAALVVDDETAPVEAAVRGYAGRNGLGGGIDIRV